METFSDQLRREVAESGLSAYELAIRAGVASASLNRFISGRSGLYSPTLDRLAEALDLTVCKSPRPSKPTVMHPGGVRAERARGQ